MSKSKNIAVDIAVIPEDTNNIHILNNKLYESNKSNGFKFDDSHIPHVTLVQFICDEENISELCHHIQKLINHDMNIHDINFNITNIDKGPVFDGYHIPCLVVEPTKSIQVLHENMMKLTENFDQYFNQSINKVDSNMFYTTNNNNDKIGQSAIDYVQNFRKNAAYNKFFPHVTLGSATLETIETLPNNPPYPWTNQSGYIALYQLGHDCTCRKLIQSFKL